MAGGWIACPQPDASVMEILEAFADRATIEQDFHDVKEVWGTGQQQVRKIWTKTNDHAERFFNLNGGLVAASKNHHLGRTSDDAGRLIDSIHDVIYRHLPFPRKRPKAVFSESADSIGTCRQPAAGDTFPVPRPPRRSLPRNLAESLRECSRILLAPSRALQADGGAT